MTEPLPAVNEDPSFVEGLAVRDEYTRQAAAIRGDFTITDIAKAQRITEVWTAANAKLVSLYENLQTRRRARAATLTATIPVGPNIPPGTNAADAALLHQVFRTALADARAASPTELASMLSDAERYDDDTARRAVLTAAIESSQMNLVQQWTDTLGLTDELTELMTVRDSIEGRGFQMLWIRQAFEPIPQPDEAADLPRLVAAQAAATKAAGELAFRTRSGAPGTGPR